MLRLPPPVWALIYLLLAAGISWLAGWPTIAWLHSPALGILLFGFGWVPPIWAAAGFRHAGTEFNPTSPTNSALVTSGPFQFTRNPMYLGLVVITLGLAVWIGAWPMFLVPIATFATCNWVHIPFEEAKMRRQFGEAFDAYAAKVRRWV
jgi:protein-S-isoprenylcysteine O-methyltransferase Ste14